MKIKKKTFISLLIKRRYFFGTPGINCSVLLFKVDDGSHFFLWSFLPRLNGQQLIKNWLAVSISPTIFFMSNGN